MRKENIKIADIGTGSAAISIAIALNIPNSLVYACDISYKALEIATENINKYSLEDKNLINRATKGVYELGSVFKTFTYAAGLNEGLINPDTEFKNLKRKIYCSKFLIGEYDDEIPTNLTAEQILSLIHI